MELILNYTVKLGKYDNNEDVFEWKATLTEEQEEAYNAAVMTGDDFEDVPELQELCEEVYAAVEKQELQKMLRAKDDYEVLKALGEVTVDAEEMNKLVHSKDPYALQFFNLESLTDNELDKWDAAEFERLPLVKEYRKDFIPQSPFGKEYQYRIEVWIPESEGGPGDKAIEEGIREALSENDLQRAYDIILEHEEEYSGNIVEAAFRIAEEVGCQAFLEQNKQ